MVVKLCLIEVLILISLITNAIKNIFINSLHSFFCELSVYILYPFPFGVCVFFFLLVFKIQFAKYVPVSLFALFVMSFS